jgi:hypothetical protein
MVAKGGRLRQPGQRSTRFRHFSRSSRSTTRSHSLRCHSRAAASFGSVLPHPGMQSAARKPIDNAIAFKAAAARDVVEASKIANFGPGGQAGTARISGSRIGRFTMAAIAASAMSAYHIHW